SARTTTMATTMAADCTFTDATLVSVCVSNRSTRCWLGSASVVCSIRPSGGVLPLGGLLFFLYSLGVGGDASRRHYLGMENRAPDPTGAGEKIRRGWSV
ncbi:MAG: hypothetical protein KDA41_20820, partial [Planctomycetales bacterium]|nr:hypothetical protein [Planctomycetales bacterium]